MRLVGQGVGCPVMEPFWNRGEGGTLVETDGSIRRCDRARGCVPQLVELAASPLGAASMTSTTARNAALGETPRIPICCLPEQWKS